MIDILKEIWFKWRAKVYENKITKLSNARHDIKTKQLACKTKVEAYSARATELNRK